MRHMQGLRYGEISERTNISVKAVERHLSVGLLKCRAYLEEREYEPSEFGADPQKMMNQPIAGPVQTVKPKASDIGE